MAKDWEPTFQGWSSPPGVTERDKASHAESAIKNAVASSNALGGRRVTAFLQGSYRNRTNVRTESDVDVCVFCRDSIFFDLPDGYAASDFGITTPASYPYAQYKEDLYAALTNYLGAAAVTWGRKSFDVHENSYRIDADAVPCWEYRRYRADGSYLEGTALLLDNETRIVNWPQQNYDNGVAKNQATGRRYKAIVRILKHLRRVMDDGGISAARDVPGFLIECLVWNVPNKGFGHNSLTADVRFALAHLFNNTRSTGDCGEWGEVNELKYLFRISQPWTLSQAHSFLDAAWDYIDFPD